MQGLGSLVWRGWAAPWAGGLLDPQVQSGGVWLAAMTRKGHPGDSVCGMFTRSCPALCPALGLDLPLPRGDPRTKELVTGPGPLYDHQVPEEEEVPAWSEPRLGF